MMGSIDHKPGLSDVCLRLGLCPGQQVVIETGLLGRFDNSEVRRDIKITRGEQGVVPDVMYRGRILPATLFYKRQYRVVDGLESLRNQR